MMNNYVKLPLKIKRIFFFIYNWLIGFGIDLRIFLVALRRFPTLLKDYYKIREQNAINTGKWVLHFNSPNLLDKNESGGTTSGHYFHQDLLIARKIFQRNPLRHIDVGSRIDGFVAHVAVFRTIEVLDIRPVPSSLLNML